VTRHPVARARGAALLIALLVLSLVALAASTMLMHQQRAIAVEGAERARADAGWILNGAMDWARLILREDARSSAVQTDHLGEPWAVPLSEARLSTFLAADTANSADLDLEAFLSGRITDMQSRYNLVRLAGEDGKPSEVEAAALRRLCEAAGLAGDVADRLATGMVAALDGSRLDGPLRPRRLDQLAWLGLDAATIEQLEPLVALLPVRTPVNANTAAREVILAAIDGIDLGTADRIVQARQRKPFENMTQLRELLPQGVTAEDGRIGVASSFFMAYGRMRLEERVVEERALIERRPGGGDVIVRQRERVSMAAGGR
jgi:general secretion pathway protein K